MTAHVIPRDPPTVAGWKEIPVEDAGSPLVALGPFSDYGDVFTDAVYAGERLDSPYRGEQSLSGSLMTLFVRREVAERLRRAQRMLPWDMRLVVFDAYRTLEVQGSLYTHFHDELARLHPDWPEEQLSAETQRFVSLPSTDPTRPSPHNTGGAVDVAIVRLSALDALRLCHVERALARERTWERRYELEMRRTALMRGASVLEFGTRFDHGGEESTLAHLERLGEQRPLTAAQRDARDNRRLLASVMSAAGMQPYADEWWHWNAPESQMGARTAGLPVATYGAATLSAENIRHERIRRAHHDGCEKIFLGERTSTVPALRRHLAVASRAIALTGDPRQSAYPKAERIAPAGVALWPAPSGVLVGDL